ncbi:MAG: rhomboid family intramembrane serine protease [Bernardetiaceae bacterium]
MFLERLFEIDGLGIRAGEGGSWPQLFTAAFAHGSWGHFWSNALALGVLGVALFHFFPAYALRVFVLLPWVSMIPVWLWARPAVHLGASGWVFGLIGFLFFGGIFQKNKSGWAISGAVLVLYGGVLAAPTDAGISWEAHLSGGLLGSLMALLWVRVPLGVSPEVKPSPDFDYTTGYRPIENQYFRYEIRED